MSVFWMAGMSIAWITLAAALLWMLRKWRIYDKVSISEKRKTPGRDISAAVKDAMQQVRAGRGKLDPKAKSSAELLRGAMTEVARDDLVACLKTWLREKDDDRLSK